jgi:hypothetical protein
MKTERVIPDDYTDPQNVEKHDIILYAFDHPDLGPATMTGGVCEVMTDPATDELLFRVKSGGYVNVNTNQFAAIIERPTNHDT